MPSKTDNTPTPATNPNETPADVPSDSGLEVSNPSDSDISDRVNNIFDLSKDALADDAWDDSYEGILVDVEPASDNTVILRGYKKKRAKASEGAPLYVMIGDSYGTQRPHLADLLAEKLKLKEAGGDYYCYFCGGYGAARTLKNRNFQRLLNRLPSNKAVTDVLYFGGVFNDKKYSREEIEAAITSLAIRTREKYPNARIMYAIGNWHSNDYRTKRRYSAVKYQQLVLQRIPWYRQACIDNGIIFLNSVTNTLHASNNQKFFKGDGHHPGKIGTKKLVKALGSAIQKLNQTMRIRSIVLNKKSLQLRKGQSAALTAKVSKGADAVSEDVLFLSEKPSICRVDKKTGTVTAVSPGTCKIICRAADGSGTQAVCTVKVS